MKFIFVAFNESKDVCTDTVVHWSLAVHCLGDELHKWRLVCGGCKSSNLHTAKMVFLLFLYTSQTIIMMFTSLKFLSPNSTMT
jgi:hypothetical protein